jgi:hypothetical protein
LRAPSFSLIEYFPQLQAFAAGCLLAAAPVVLEDEADLIAP